MHPHDSIVNGADSLIFLNLQDIFPFIFSKLLTLTPIPTVPIQESQIHTSEVEPFGPGQVIVGRGSVIDASRWMHAIPTEQK